MAVLSVSNLVLSFGDRIILDGANLTLNEGEHVGLVGNNGTGKSTLMKLVVGTAGLKADAGQVQVARGATVGYLTQEPQLNLEHTLREEAATAFAHLQALHDKLQELTHQMSDAEGDELDRLLKRYEQIEHQMQAAGGYAVDHLIDATLHGLGLGNELFNVPVGSLSGGQKARLSLAKLLLSSPDLLLLDEPTNHLDIAGRQWLEEFLAGYRGAVVIISHDRWLLNRVASKIYELEDGRLVEYPGNYEKFRELRALRRVTLLREYEKQQEKIKREQAFIDRYRAGQRARQAQGREKRLERFKDQTMDKPLDLDAMSLRFGAAQRTGDLIINADGLAKGYESKPLFSHVFLTLKRGDRIGIIGPNGAGKSTLVRCLLGEIEPDAGHVRVGAQVNVGHFQQTHEHLNLSLTVVEYLRHQLPPNASEQAARDLAGAFLFSGLEQEKPLSVMSGGERSRAVLAGLVAGNHNVLVLDEPSNHLDITSAERLEEALKQFTEPPAGFGQQTSGGGTLILISHDRWLLESLVDQLLVLDGEGRLSHFHGKYSEYAAAEKAATSAPASTRTESKPKATPAKPAEKPQAKPTAKGKSAFAHLNQQALEQKIILIERELAAVDQSLADPDLYRDGGKVRTLQSRRDQLAKELKPLEEEWARRAAN